MKREFKSNSRFHFETLDFDDPLWLNPNLKPLVNESLEKAYGTAHSLSRMP